MPGTYRFDASVSADQGLVFVRDAAVSASADGTSFEYQNGCMDVRSAEAEPEHLCVGSDPTALFKTLGMPAELQPPKLSFGDYVQELLGQAASFETFDSGAVPPGPTTVLPAD